jgi:hypothetical protein
MTKVSKYLSYKEVTKSDRAIKRGINNTPNSVQMRNIIEWSRKIFDPVRSFIRKPLGCNSVFRSDELNTELGGSFTSQHMANNGAAGDIDADVYENSDNETIFNYIKDDLDFDQLIAEGIHIGEIAWVHCSYVNPERNRKEVLVMYVEDGRKHYEHYSDDRYVELMEKFKK